MKIHLYHYSDKCFGVALTIKEKEDDFIWFQCVRQQAFICKHQMANIIQSQLCTPTQKILIETVIWKNCVTCERDGQINVFYGSCVTSNHCPLAEKKHAVLWNIIQEHLYLDVYEGIARNKQQIVATAGGMVGEANRQANRTKVFYGKCSSKFNLTHIKRTIYIRKFIQTFICKIIF